jgi:tetratricopeptide (TPR) repeat protein
VGDSIVDTAPESLVKAKQVFYFGDDRNTALLLLAESYIGAGLPDSAIAVFNQIKGDISQDSEIWLAKAFLAYIACDFAQSGEFLQQAIRLKPGLYRNLLDYSFLREVIISQNLQPSPEMKR